MIAKAQGNRINHLPTGLQAGGSFPVDPAEGVARLLNFARHGDKM